MPRLSVTHGPDAGRSFDLVGPATIGRESTCPIRLSDVEISRRHAEISPWQGAYRIVDRESVNGIFVNDRKVSSAELRNGDRIRIGVSILQYADEGDRGNLAEQVRLLAQPREDVEATIRRRLDAAAALPNTHLDILYEAIRAAGHILDLDLLLDKMLELLARSVEADRGCVLLRNDPASPPTPRALRWRAGHEPNGEIAISRTIVDYVADRRQGVLIADAADDSRFQPGASVLRHGIREAICVPLIGRHGDVGVLYCDTFRPQRPGGDEQPRFTDAHLELAVAVAHHIALAVEETRYHQALVQAERLAAVGQTVAVLSHHIKNILQGLKSGGDLLKLGMADKNDELLRSGWQLVESNQRRILELVLDMLSYSKQREPLREPTDLAGIVRDVVELLSPQAAERGVNWTVECDNLPVIQADREGIHRALLNLVTNALDAVEGCEQPTIAIRGTVEAGGDFIRIAVVDNGSGIEPEQLSDLFQPFCSTKGSRGTGLGLAVSRKTSREHGGDVFVTSAPGRGSEFVLRLPVGK